MELPQVQAFIGNLDGSRPAYQHFGAGPASGLSCRWLEGHLRAIPFATGQAHTCCTTAVSWGYTSPKLANTLQAGISNAFETNNTRASGGP